MNLLYQKMLQNFYLNSNFKISYWEAIKHNFDFEKNTDKDINQVLYSCYNLKVADQPVVHDKLDNNRDYYIKVESSFFCIYHLFIPVILNFLSLIVPVILIFSINK